MAIIQRVETQIDVLRDRQLGVAVYTITEDSVTGEEMAPAQVDRRVIDVEDDVTAEAKDIKDIASLVWTPAVKSARQVKRAEEAAKMEELTPPIVEE